MCGHGTSDKSACVSFATALKELRDVRLHLHPGIILISIRRQDTTTKKSERPTCAQKKKGLAERRR